MRQANLDFDERERDADATPDSAGFGGGLNSEWDYDAPEPDDPRLWIDAEVAIESETDYDHRKEHPYTTPVIPPDRMLDFQRQWHHRPALRMLIRTAGKFGRERCARSKWTMALWEMFTSDAFQSGGHGERAELRADIRDAWSWIDRMERQRQLRREQGVE